MKTQQPLQELSLENSSDKVLLNNPKSIWKLAKFDAFTWAYRFKEIFIKQQLERLPEIFDVENFGLHNGLDCRSYCAYEFEEFALKCEHFGLTMDAQIACYQLEDNFLYFALGKQKDRALFEAIFRYDSARNIAVGNQYQYRIEPKLQFYKQWEHLECPEGDPKATLVLSPLLYTKRKVNIKGVGNIRQVVGQVPGEENMLQRHALEDIMGGEFYSWGYSRLQEDNLSYYDTIQIVRPNGMGIVKQRVVMRGRDHPLFKDNLYPHLSRDRKTISYCPDIFPVIIYAQMENGQEVYYKYPKERQIVLPFPARQVCLTDTLSFDWIIHSPT